MTTETVVEPRSERVAHIHMHKVGYANRIIKKRRCKRRNSKSFEGEVPMVLQQLYLSCKEVFKGHGIVPSPHDVERLRHLLDKMKPEDVGLSSEMRFFKPKPAIECTPRVSTATIYKCDKFSLCIFFLPATAVIPLHNHPEMTVFSKLLLGTMQIKSYDLVSPPSADEPVQSSNLRLAKLVTDSVFEAPCDTSVLYPTTGGNIHQFTAITPCAVLDVLGPPYSKEDGRDGSYYKDHPYNAFANGEMKLIKEDGESYGWLEEIEMPENSKMDGIVYLGPQIIER
ncbi:plant cysteine oxidase 2-like [Mercurialis annua]|uniref:plant cysteine oxidase 2-like n=1 Tax=Mercurialis annua TaxID=3986 RepID=UPI00215EB5F7|nr:plant cysteine oxidase 2-like [Mercurialis annua]